MNILPTIQLMSKFGFSVSRHTKHRQFWTELPRLCDETWSIQFQHDDICDEKIDLVGLTRMEELKRGSTCRCLNHPEDLAAQRAGAKQANRVFVLHQDDGTHARQIQWLRDQGLRASSTFAAWGGR